jgi:hypothetical protein
MDLINERLDRYAELRRFGLTRHECAERIGVTYGCLEKLLQRFKDDPRSDSVSKAEICAQWQAQRRTHAGLLEADPDEIRKAALTVCACCPEDARTLLQMLGLVA